MAPSWAPSRVCVAVFICAWANGVSAYLGGKGVEGPLPTYHHLVSTACLQLADRVYLWQTVSTCLQTKPVCTSK